MADEIRVGPEHLRYVVNKNQELAHQNQELAHKNRVLADSRRTWAERYEGLKQRLEGAHQTTRRAISSAGQRLGRKPEDDPDGKPVNIARAIRTLEVNGGSFLGGLIQGKAGPDGGHFLHLPVEAWLAIAAEGVGYFGIGGEKVAEHATAIGDGLLASYTSSLGFRLGSDWRARGSLFGAKNNPALPAANGPAVQGEITPQQMAQIVARVRGAAAMHGMPPPHG